MTMTHSNFHPVQQRQLQRVNRQFKSNLWYTANARFWFC